MLVGNGYDSNTHRPYQASMREKEELGADVGFIGGFETDRYRQMLNLAQNGVALRIRGSFWETVVGSHPLLKITCGCSGPFVLPQDFPLQLKLKLLMQFANLLMN